MQDPDAPTSPRAARAWWVYLLLESLKGGTVCEWGGTRWRPPSFHPDNDVEVRPSSPAASRRVQRFPTIGRYVDGPPCVQRSRAGATPISPEGERFCGIPVWRNYSFETLADKRVM